MHANALWKMGRCEEAVRVWGEVCHAPPHVYVSNLCHRDFTAHSFLPHNTTREISQLDHSTLFDSTFALLLSRL